MSQPSLAGGPAPAAPSARPPTPPDVPLLSEARRAALAAANVALRTAMLAAATARRGGRAGDALHESAGALQQAVCDCVAELMAAGESPERVLGAVRRAAMEAGVPERGRGEDGALMLRIVRWCIEAYYRDA